MRKTELTEFLALHKQLENIQSELLDIKNYINQFFTKEEQIILMYEASVGRNGTVLEKLTSEEIKSYAASCESYLKFGREVDACMAYELKQFTAVRLGPIPAILEKTGCSQNDMYITQKHLRSIVHEKTIDTPHYHDIDIKQFKRLPELMENPLAIISSERDSDTIVVVLDAKDNSNNQLFVPVPRNGYAIYQEKRVEANFILSAYGKTNIEMYLEKSVLEGRVLFADKKISTILGSESLQLRQFLNDTYTNIIPPTGLDVKRNHKENPDKNKENKDVLKIEKDIKL